MLFFSLFFAVVGEFAIALSTEYSFVDRICLHGCIHNPMGCRKQCLGKGCCIASDIDTDSNILQSLYNKGKAEIKISETNEVIAGKNYIKEFAEKMQVPQEILEDIEEIKNGIVNFSGKYFIFTENDKKRTILIQLKFTHKLNGKEIQFDIDEESDGTQRLLDLLPMLFAMRENSQAIYFVDEIDRSLHTKLSQYLLNEFINCCENTYNQIIFTAHDVNLININDFRQEEIWLIEKNNLGETRLRPLSDFNLQKGQDALKAYLSGRFGAIPVIRRVV